MERTHGELTFRWPAGAHRVEVLRGREAVNLLLVGWNRPLCQDEIDRVIDEFMCTQAPAPSASTLPDLQVLQGTNPLFTELGRAWADVDAGRPAPSAPRRRVRMGVWLPPRHRHSPLTGLLRRGAFAVGCAIGLAATALMVGLVGLATVLWGGRGLLAALAVVVVALALIGITRER